MTEQDILICEVCKKEIKIGVPINIGSGELFNSNVILHRDCYEKKEKYND